MLFGDLRRALPVVCRAKKDGTWEKETAAHPVGFLLLFDVAGHERLLADLLDGPQRVSECEVRKFMRLVAARPPRGVKRVVDDDATAVSETERRCREGVRLQLLQFLKLLDRYQFVGRHHADTEISRESAERDRLVFAAPEALTDLGRAPFCLSLESASQR
jgi:hypothetical protein